MRQPLSPDVQWAMPRTATLLIKKNDCLVNFGHLRPICAAAAFCLFIRHVYFLAPGYAGRRSDKPGGPVSQHLGHFQCSSGQSGWK